MNYVYMDCPECHKTMTPDEKQGLWNCTCNVVVEDRLPPRTLTDWERHEENTCVSMFRDNRQEVTLRCPAGCGQFISTDWEGCYGCGFKWGDKV